MTKPKVAFFDFACCEGCQLQIANLEEAVIDLLGVVDLVSFREVMKEHSDDYDIAFIEGCIQRPMDAEALKKIRENASIIVAYGACAVDGSVHTLRNEFTKEDVLNEVYGDADVEGNPYWDIYDKAKPIDEVVKVDVYIPGCPIDRDEFARIVSDVLQGKAPKLPNYAICVECKKNENICLFELGEFCLGPITRAGCNSACPNVKSGCEGCRGFLDDPRTSAHKEVLEKYGVSVDEMMAAFSIFQYGKEGS